MWGASPTGKKGIACKMARANWSGTHHSETVSSKRSCDKSVLFSALLSFRQVKLGLPIWHKKITLWQKIWLTKIFILKEIFLRKITNLTRNSLKMPFFPGHFESTNSRITKNNSQGVIFVIILCHKIAYEKWFQRTFLWGSAKTRCIARKRLFLSCK